MQSPSLVSVLATSTANGAPGTRRCWCPDPGLQPIWGHEYCGRGGWNGCREKRACPDYLETRKLLWEEEEEESGGTGHLVLYSRFLLVIYSIHGSQQRIYVSPNCPIFPPLFSVVSMWFSLSVSLSASKYHHLYHFLDGPTLLRFIVRPFCTHKGSFNCSWSSNVITNTV